MRKSSPAEKAPNLDTLLELVRLFRDRHTPNGIMLGVTDAALRSAANELLKDAA